MSLIKCSIVLVAKDIFPPINHDFLLNKKIIPDSFRPKNNFLSAPVLSQIYYDNGFSFITAQNKTTVQFEHPKTMEESAYLDSLSALKDISSRYIKLFDYISYQAIGFNFEFIRENMRYNSLIEKIIKQNDSHLIFEGNKAEVHNLALSYNLKGKQFNVTIMRAEELDKKKIVPVFNINAHYPKNYAENKLTIIEELKSNYELSKMFIDSFNIS